MPIADHKSMESSVYNETYFFAGFPFFTQALEFLILKKSDLLSPNELMPPNSEFRKVILLPKVLFSFLQANF